MGQKTSPTISADTVAELMELRRKAAERDIYYEELQRVRQTLTLSTETAKREAVAFTIQGCGATGTPFTLSLITRVYGFLTGKEVDTYADEKSETAQSPNVGYAQGEAVSTGFEGAYLMNEPTVEVAGIIIPQSQYYEGQRRHAEMYATIRHNK